MKEKSGRHVRFWGMSYLKFAILAECERREDMWGFGNESELGRFDGVLPIGLS